MSRFKVLGIDEAPDASAEQLEGIKEELGKVPNIFGIMAHSPAVLASYNAFSGALDDAELSGALREKIALAVSEINQCDYCLAAHSAIGKMQGLDQDAILSSRKAAGDDDRENAALKLASKIVVQRAEVNDDDIQKARDAGLTDAEILEIVAVVALTIFTNYFNHVADTDIDFPKAQPL